MAENTGTKGFFTGILSNAAWDSAKQLVGGALMTSFGAALWGYLRHRSVDWWGILALFVLTFAVLFWRIKPRATQPATEMSGGSPSPDTDESLSQLQTDALRLSTELLSFLKRMGSPPWPKYTSDQIRGMSDATAISLINANDKDYDAACEFWFGQRVENPSRFIPDVEGQTKATVVRWRLMDPWFEKVRASYVLSGFPQRVESLRNRFAVEGFTENDLNLPVEGGTAKENIQTIASDLWALAYKVRAKEIPIEQSGIQRRFGSA